MTSREEFEAWADSKSITGGNRRIARLTWMACRDLTLEEAAKECDRMRALYEFRANEPRAYRSNIDLDYADAAEQCAMGIRALK